MTEEIAAKLEDAERGVGAATLLLSQGYADIAISRAYYSMFYAAQALLESIGLGFSKHGAVLAKYGEFYAKTGELPPELHRYILDAFTDRQTADYEHRRQPWLHAPETHIARAREFLAAAQEYLERLDAEAAAASDPDQAA